MRFLKTLVMSGFALGTSAFTVAHAQTASTTITVAGRSSANPTVAANGNFVAVAFSAATMSTMDIFVATSRDGGMTFASPVRVNRIDGEARVSGEEPPRVALVARRGLVPEIVVLWTAKAGTKWTLLSARSLDGGRSYTASESVPGSTGEGSRGWQSVAVDATGKISVLWLDHRDLATVAATESAAESPTERAKRSQLLFSTLPKRAGVGSATASAHSVARSVCYCCKTALAVSGNNVFAAWRHVYPSGERDIAFTTSTNGGRTFAALQRVSADHWKLDGCPDNGPAIAVDAMKRVHVVWPTAAEGTTATSKEAMTLSIYYAISSAGKAFGPRVRVPAHGSASHPQIVTLANGQTLVAWDEVVDGTRRLGMARAAVSASGAIAFTPVSVPDAGPGQWYPALASSSRGAVITWVRQLEHGSAVGVAVIK